MAQQRRKRGTGRIERQPDGTYIARTAGGERSGRFAGRPEAEKTLAEWNTQIARGVDLAGARQRVRAFLAQWLDTRAGKVRPSTISFYRRHLEYTGPHIGDLALEALRPLHVERMLTALAADGLAPQSVAHVRSVLRAALGQAVKWRLLTDNAAALTDAPRVERYAAHALTATEAGALLTACAGHRLEALVLLALGLGLRRGELLALRWADVDMDARTLRVAESKTTAGRRTLPLTTPLVAALRAHWQTQLEERSLLGTRWKEHGLVFASEVGTAIGGRNLTRTFKALLSRAGLSSDIRLHDLRHTAATDLIDAGADPKVAQAILGHASPLTTMGIYAHARSDRLRGAVEAAEEKRRRSG